MIRKKFHNLCRTLCVGVAVVAWGITPHPAEALTDQEVRNLVRTTGVADHNGNPNWAYSPTTMEKFVDGLPLLCNDKSGTDIVGGANNLGQCIPVAVPDTTTYPGSDYYEFEVVQYREQMHSDLPAINNADPMLATAGGSLLRGYRQTNNTGASTAPATPHQMGPMIIADYDRPVRIKLVNDLPIEAAGNLFIPTDTTVMGSGPGPLHDWTGDPRSPDEVCEQEPGKCFTQNRTTIHLHGGRSPWISDGTAHQWITPAGEFPGGLDPRDPYYRQGVSISNVPDMWFDPAGNTVTACAGQTFCLDTTATNDPGAGAQTYYWTNTQSARLMFYHEHAWGITRLGVYAGLVAGYLITDDTEQELITAGIIPDGARTIPLIIQDKTFVDASTIVDDTSTPDAFDGTDPTWIWGSQPGTLYPWDETGAAPVTGDLWWPHVYVAAQNPYHPDLSGVNPYGRWHYGVWFWPPTDVPYGPIPNPYWDGVTGEQATKPVDPEPPEIPGTPHPSWGAEAFLDTPVINGTAYPTLTVEPEIYRFKILNGAHDRFWNLQLYQAVDGFDCATGLTQVSTATEVAMVPAVATNGFPGHDGGPADFPWPTDGREGGVPDPATRGPEMVQIATDGGFLPAPVELPNRPVNWNYDPTTFNAGLVLQQNQGGGTLMIGPAERADVLVDFSTFAGQTLILYNDAPAPWPALDPHYDYYSCNPDYFDIGGTGQTNPGFGPNTRTIMQIVVTGTPVTPEVNAAPTNLAAIQTAFLPRSSGGLGVFDEGQEPIIVGQDAYDANYPAVDFPSTWPNWGLSRITDTEISFMTPEGSIVNMYPMEPKAIQDEQGETFDDFGRMRANLGLEKAQTTAGIQTFVTQNFVDPPTEVIAQDQIQIWKITHNGVDSHPVHFHLFEVQLLNRVAWDGFIYLPDANEIGWKDTIKMHPLEDTIVALRPVHVPTPFEIPNSIRPLNPATPLGSEFGFTNLDPETGEPRTEPVVNEVLNMGHEYLWHCHILSHEEQDMMRVIVLNQDSLLFTENTGDGFWQWKRGDWSQIAPADPENIVSSGPFAYADFGADGLWQWNGYDWRKITAHDPILMHASTSGLYANFTGLSGLYGWSDNTWTHMTTNTPLSMVSSDSTLYVHFDGLGLYEWTGTGWTLLTSFTPALMAASSTDLFVKFSELGGIYQWNGTVWTHITGHDPSMMVANYSGLFVKFPAFAGIYQINGTVWTHITGNDPTDMVTTKTNLFGYFNGIGLYKWNGGAWSFLSSLQPDDMATTPSILFANFGGDVQKYEHNAWIPLPNSLTTFGVTGMSAGF